MYKESILINVINNTLRIGSLHWKGVSNHISQISKNKIYDNEKRLYHTLSHLIDLFPEVDGYYIDNYHEVFKLFKEYDKIKLLKKIFDSKGIGDKLYFLDNNLSYCDDSLNLKGEPYFLGLSYLNNKVIENRKFDKKFLFLNRLRKMHRAILYENFKKENVLNDFIYSFDSHDESSPWYKQISANSNTFNDNVWEHHTYNVIPEYTTTFCNIVTETNFGYYVRNWEFEGTPGCIFITEKTEKCFAAGQPFIIVSNNGFLKKLKEIGFKTFDKWWDESYDDEFDSDERLSKINDLVLEINSWSMEKCEQVYQEMIPILKHNQELNNKWYFVNSKEIKYFPNFSGDWNQYSVEINGNESTKTEISGTKMNF